MDNNIKLLFLDVDGTLTDGKIYMGDNGEFFKAFDIKDGLGIHELLPKLSITPVIITGRRSKILTNRCLEIGINEVHQGVSDKLTCLRDIIKKFNYSNNQVAYMGDDINDLQTMKFIHDSGGINACPSDAVNEIKEISDFISVKCGGSGAVRDFIEYLSSIR